MRPNWGGKGAARGAALAVAVALAACSGGEKRVASTPRPSSIVFPFEGKVDLATGTLTVTPLPSAGAPGALSFEGTMENIPVVQNGLPGDAVDALEMDTGTIRTRPGGCYDSGHDSLEAYITIRNGFTAVDLKNVYVELYQIPAGYESCMSAPVGYPRPPFVTDPPLALFAYPDIAHGGGTASALWSFQVAGALNFTFRGVVWAERYELTPPVTTASPAGSYPAPQALTLSCTDGGGTGSGCAGTFYTIDGGPTTPYTAPILLSGTQNICYWSLDLRGNEETPHTCGTWNVTMAGGATATYDPSLHVPRCASLGSGCDTGPTLIHGRASITGGVESGAPNTLDGCDDGTFGVYGTNESLDRLAIAVHDGGPLMGGKLVDVTADVWAVSASDHLDLFTATSTSSPVWIWAATVQPTAGGAQTLSAQFTLPAGAVALRGHFGFDSLYGSGSACGTGTTDDQDDLVFTTQGLPAGSSAPSVSITEPTGGTPTDTSLATLQAKAILVKATASDDVAVTSVAFFSQCYDSNIYGTNPQGVVPLGVDTSPPWVASWDTASTSNACYWADLWAVATDNAGQQTTSAIVVVRVLDRTAPTVTWTSPSDGSSFPRSTAQAVTVHASDNTGVFWVDFYTDGHLFCTAYDDGNGNFSCPFDDTGLSAAQHVLYGIAHDFAGNVRQSPLVTVTLTP
jgi:hypothetical protein